MCLGLDCAFQVKRNGWGNEKKVLQRVEKMERGNKTNAKKKKEKTG